MIHFLVACTLTVGTLQAKGDEAVDPALIERLALTMAKEVERVDEYDAEVWFLSNEQKLRRFVRNPDERVGVLHNVYREANRTGLDPDLVLAVIQVESAFDRFAVSSAGAQGLMQVMPFWRLEIGRPQDNLTSNETNIRYGTTILAYYIEVADGDLVDALARYNGSRGRLKYPEKVVHAMHRTWQSRPTNEIPALRDGCAAYGLTACR